MLGVLLLACSSPPPRAPVAAPEPPAPAGPPWALDRPLPCAPGCALDEQVRAAVAQGVAWLDRTAATPESRDPRLRLTLDVAIGLHGIGRVYRGEALDTLITRLGPELDRGGDPRRRAFDATARLPAEAVASWTPQPGARTSPNRALVEAMYCPEHGFRPQSVQWVCAELRDGGGLLSAHAAWILDLAVDAGCVDRDATCLDTVVTELENAAATPGPLAATMDRDRLAEQVLFGARAGLPPAALEPAVRALLAAQGPDGGFGVPTEEEPPWWGYHATLAATWGLAEWAATREVR